MSMRIKTILAYLVAMLIFALSTTVILAYMYSQRYVQDSPNTATTGIFFKKTLKLDVYENVASGNGWLGTYDRYSRSDRHSDVITVYCKEYCGTSD